MLEVPRIKNRNNLAVLLEIPKKDSFSGSRFPYRIPTGFGSVRVSTPYHGLVFILKDIFLESNGFWGKP
jgi:hypothetical protein